MNKRKWVNLTDGGVNEGEEENLSEKNSTFKKFLKHMNKFLLSLQQK
jgi:hypothetical protein